MRPPWIHRCASPPSTPGSTSAFPIGRLVANARLRITAENMTPIELTSEEVALRQVPSRRSEDDHAAPC